MSQETTAGWGSGPTVGKGRGKTGGRGRSGVLWELPQSMIQTQQTQEGHTNWGDGITYTHSLAPLTEGEDRNWRPAWAQDRARGTGQPEPTGQLLATLLWKVICKGKVLRGIWCFPRQLPVRSLTPQWGKVRGRGWNTGEVFPRESRTQTSDPLVFAPDDQALGRGNGHCPRPWHPPSSPQTRLRPHTPGDRDGSGQGQPVSLAVKWVDGRPQRLSVFYQDGGSSPGDMGTCDLGFGVDVSGQGLHTLRDHQGPMTQGKRIRNAHEVSPTSLRSRLSVEYLPLPVTGPERFHVWPGKSDFRANYPLSSALSSQPAIPVSPAPWKHPEASASRGEGLRPGSWQISRQLAVGADGVPALLGQAWFEAQGHSGGHARRVSHCQEGETTMGILGEGRAATRTLFGS